MNRRQKALVVNLISVTLITAAFVVGMTILKDWLNKSEAKRAMEHIGQAALDYRSRYGSLPAQSYLEPIKNQHVRLGQFHYRAQWIDFESGPDAILAYSKKDFHGIFIKSGYFVLRLNGTVQWMGVEEFEKLLHTQQSRREIEILQKQLEKNF